jgi:hypothetical protein
MEKLIKIISDIHDLESENMTPILSEMGVAFNGEDIQKDIAENNPGLINVYVVYSSTDNLLAYFRYHPDGENKIIVKSFQISKKTEIPYAIRRLINIAYTALYYSNYEDNLEIISWVFKHNTKSINLHAKLGFKYVDANRDAIKYSTTKKEFLKVLEKIGFNATFTPYSHPGLFPVRILQQNLPHTIESHRSGRLQTLRDAVTEGKINPGIKYRITNEYFGFIYADPKTKSIHVHETFLAFLWSFIYSTFVIYEEGVQEVSKIAGNMWDGKIDESRPIVKRAIELFYWSISLPKGFSFWPLHLPNPEVSNNAEEQFYIGKVNGIFLKTATYLTNHEIGHLINKHWEILEGIKMKKSSERSTEEKLIYKEIEADADSYAREILVDSLADDGEKLIDGISIVYAHLASLFAIKHPMYLMDDLHPDLDTRLSHAVEALGLVEDQNKDYIYLIGAIVSQQFLATSENELLLINMPLRIESSFGTSQEYFNYLLDFIDKIKEEYIRLDLIK